MSVLIIFIKLIAVFDLLVIAVYFGGDILSTMLNKLQRKPKQDDPFDFSLDTMTVSLSIDSIRQLYSGDAADFVEEKILPNAEKTMAVLTEQEQTATRLLLSALIGFIAAEAKKQLGLNIDKKKMKLDEPIKTLGTHIVTVKLHKEVTAKLTVVVGEDK